MKNKEYGNELEGQSDFWERYLPRINSYLNTEDILGNYTDGVVNGNIIEFKLTINDLNAVLFQTIKYLSQFRVKGKFIPANILLVSLNNETAYLFHSDDYIEYIEKIYTNSASKDNAGFICGEPVSVFNYHSPMDEEQMISVLKETNYTKIHLDENCIVGWSNTFYKRYPKASKADFIGDSTGKVKIIGEIRSPSKFKDYIYPYQDETNEKFRYLMDRLNDFLHKKNLGAFYTHPLYAEKSLELVREAIYKVPVGNDYVIIDRCAGTGNLEACMSDDELSHVIVSTYEYYEYKVLVEVLGDKVRHIIPPTEKEDTFDMGMVRGADALSREYIECPIIRQYIDNPNCTIILFENPPFAETTSAEHQRKNLGKQSSTWKDSYVVQQMKSALKGKAKGSPFNDKGNVFIWSAFEYYLRQPFDSYIVYSPVKYWKAQHLINKQFVRGFAFNRRHFHTNIDACIMVALWNNIEKRDSDECLELTGFDIKNGVLEQHPNPIPVKRIHYTYSQTYYDKRKFEGDQQGTILTAHKGIEAGAHIGRRIKPVVNNNILGYMVVDTSGFDNPDLHSCLLTCGIYNGNGFFLRTDNYLEKLPMFAASRYITYNSEWTERGRIMKSGDGANDFTKDVKSGKLETFLLRCLLFSVLEPQNHMRTFIGSDGKIYTNRLCFDDTHGDTIALKDIRRLNMNTEETKIFLQWEKVLKGAKNTEEYDGSMTYGLYQIKEELNIFYKDEKTKKEIYKYPSLNGDIRTLAELIKSYYQKYIVPILFHYEFLK